MILPYGEAAAVTITDASGVAEARRAAAVLAGKVGLSEPDAGKLALVATEAGTNLVRHAGRGQILFAETRHDGRVGVAVLALDRGPGIRNIRESMRDGYSTAGGAGTGLGAIERLASEFDIYSAPEKGTALLADVRPPGRAGAREPDPVECGGLSVPMPGERVSGDGWLFVPGRDGGDLIVADGLGHGVEAAAASRGAVDSFREKHDGNATELMERIDGALRTTRGAAVAVVKLSISEKAVYFTGVGNIGGAVVSGGRPKQMVSHAGTVGHTLRKVHQFRYDWPPHALLLLHSDGIASHWSFDPYPGLEKSSTMLIAAVIYRDFNRGRDDATVVVLRRRPEGGL